MDTYRLSADGILSNTAFISFNVAFQANMSLSPHTDTPHFCIPRTNRRMPEVPATHQSAPTNLSANKSPPALSCFHHVCIDEPIPAQLGSSTAPWCFTYHCINGRGIGAKRCEIGEGSDPPSFCKATSAEIQVSQKSFHRCPSVENKWSLRPNSWMRLRMGRMSADT
jgi:hypothetical protein